MTTDKTPPLKVCFDATRLRARLALGVPTGIDRVDLAYLQALRDNPRVHLQLAVCGALGVQVLRPAAAKRLVAEVMGRWQAPVGDEPKRYAALRQWLQSPALTTRPVLPAEPVTTVAHRSRRSSVTEAFAPFTKPTASTRYINTSHGQLYRPAYARWLQRAGLRGVFFVHDLIPIEYPEYNRASEPARHAARLATIAAHARSVLVNSATTRDSLQRYWTTRGVTMPPITVAPLGTGLDPAGPSRAPPQAAVPYFVALGTIEPRKNHTLLLTLWRQMVETSPTAAPRLVLVGRRGWENETVFNLLDRSPGLVRHVVECPGLGDAELLALLRGARALLNPSFAEGFGLPVAEALAAGVPVLASSLPAHREVGGDCADYLSPLDGTGWLDAIQAFSAPLSPRRNDALRRLADYRPPSWQQHLEILWQALDTPV